MYVQWVNRVCEHVKALGKRPMFWGDIIAAHPEAIKELPEDVICMTWDYSPTPREINVKSFGRMVRINICVQVFRDGIRQFTS